MERIYGIHQGNGSNQHQQNMNNSHFAKSQEDIASMHGISITTLQNYKLLSEMIPELEDLFDTGIVIKTSALAMIKQLSPDEQLSLINSIYQFPRYDIDIIYVRNVII